MVQNSTLQLTYSGALSFAETLRDNGGDGNFSLHKVGAVTLTSSGTGSYSGGTVVEGDVVAIKTVRALGQATTRWSSPVVSWI